MAGGLGKRKREQAPAAAVQPAKKVAVTAKTAAVNGKGKSHATSKATTVSDASKDARIKNSSAPTSTSSDPVHLQIVTGSYERVLHGISASIPRAALIQDDTSPSKTSSAVTFSHSFLFTAHSSAIKCMAVSPATAEADKRILATGSSDERINVYSLSTAPPPPSAQNGPQLPSLSGSTTATAENPRNRSQGSLVHHDRAITCLAFPTRTKLFSGAEDATIAISRTRDWTVLSSIKAPIPKPQGRPSGDTAAPGQIPAGVNDFAIHPSQKLMLSVGRGERCMRLWNLMTAKKAGVLNFDRALLQQVGEGKHSAGEGRKVLWDADGERFVGGFERGAAVFGIDSKPRAVLRPSPPTKLHQFRRVPAPEGADLNLVAVSTEDGRVLFYDMAVDLEAEAPDASALPAARCVATLGGPSAGIAGRVKDFEILQLGEAGLPLVVVAASSDGAIRVWALTAAELGGAEADEEAPRQVGRLVATQETGERITCLAAFPLDGQPLEEGAGEEEFAGFDEGEEDEDDDEE